MSNHQAESTVAPVLPASFHPPAYRPVQQTARSVAHRGVNSSFRLFWSAKMGLLLPAESKLEFDFLTITEVNDNVCLIRVQPEKTVYEDEDGPRRYFPDVQVAFLDGTVCMVEVKPAVHARRVANLARFARLSAHYGVRHIRFVIASEPFIRRQPRLTNSRMLLSFRNAAKSADLARRLNNVFMASSPRTLADLENTLGINQSERPQLLALALDGHFRVDLDAAPLSGLTPVHAPPRRRRPSVTRLFQFNSAPDQAGRLEGQIAART